MAQRDYTAADALIDTLIAHGVNTIFGYPGGAILPFYDALPHHPELRHILVRNEQGAAFAAQGWARSTGKLGVCVATSGPGGTNLVTGIADAFMDSIPILCITGQVPLEMIGKDMFQETDMTGVTMNITKHNYLVETAEEIVPIVTEAIYIATHGRPGPVHIDAPKNIMAKAHPRQFKIPEICIRKDDPVNPENLELSDENIEKVIRLLGESKRPVLLLGQGVKLSGADTLARELVNQLKIPTVTTVLAKGVIDHADPNYLGMLGMHGFYHANLTVHNADLIFNIGSRFDDRIVGRYDAFGKDAKIIHVDIDRSEFGKVIRPDLAIHSDARQFLQTLLNHPQLSPLNRTEWEAQIDEWKKNNPYADDTPAFTIRSCLSEIRKEVEQNPDRYILVTDVGQHQMWAALSCTVKSSLQWLTSGGAGTMGFALPAAIGAAFANPEKTVLALTGDGGIQMNIQELGVVAEHRLNVKVCVLNNSFLGMVRQWQQLFYDHNYSQVAITSPNYVKLADAYGIPGRKISSKEEMTATLPLFGSPGPAVIEFAVSKEDNIFPMVPGGKTLGETLTA